MGNLKPKLCTQIFTDLNKKHLKIELDQLMEDKQYTAKLKDMDIPLFQISRDLEKKNKIQKRITKEFFGKEFEETVKAINSKNIPPEDIKKIVDLLKEGRLNDYNNYLVKIRQHYAEGNMKEFHQEIKKMAKHRPKGAGIE